MGREIKRVAIDFDWPMSQVWSGFLNPSDSDEWTAQEPPAGEGWQVWETVSEGSPVTPVFSTPEALAHHLSEKGDAWAQARAARGMPERLPTYEQALAFVMDGWAPTTMVIGGAVLGPYEAP
jgi:hypothetical protein